MKPIRIIALICLFMFLVAPVFGAKTLGVQSARPSGTYLVSSTTGIWDTWQALSLSTGTILKLVADDDNLTSGYYFGCYGGSSYNTAVFTIGEGGKTVISPTTAAATADALTLTGTNQTSGNLLKMSIVDGTNTTGTYIKCVDGSANVDFSVGETGAVVVGGALSVGTTSTFTSNSTFGGTVNVDGASTLASLVCTAAGTFGGGYGSTGATISTAGVGQFNGALTTDGALTADNIVCTNAATFGGGYGSTGATIATTGTAQFDGLITAAAGLTSSAAITGLSTVATASLGTVRNVYGKAVASYAGSTSGTGLLTGTRGEVSVDSGTTIASGVSLYGAQGKLINAGTMNHEDSRLCALLAQLDTSAGTYTSGQISALWVDGGATSVAGTLGGQYNMIRITNTTVAVPNAVIYAYSEGSYFLDLGAPGGNADWFASGGTDCTASGATDPLGTIKINFNGTPAYIRVWAAQ